MSPQKKLIFISTIEPSGDLFASKLVAELRKSSSHLEFLGVGGDKMAEAGVTLLHKTTSMGTVGVVEALTKIPFLYIVFKKVVGFFKSNKPDLFISIDSQGFNVPLSKEAKKLNIKTVYYVAPQEWLWGTVKGLKKVIASNDLILNIFKNAHSAYIKYGGNAKYCGHPLLDVVNTSLNKEDCKKQLSFNSSDIVVGIFPGNRKQEVYNVFPILLESAKLLQVKIPNIKFVVPLFSSLYKDKIHALIENSGLNIKFVEGQSHVVIKASDLVVSTPGTVTMECLILNTPVIAAYRVHPVTYIIAKFLLRLKMKYHTMPSLLASQLIIPEFIQHNCRAVLISQECHKILAQPIYRDNILNNYSSIISQLAPSGSFYCASKNIIDILYK